MSTIVHPSIVLTNLVKNYATASGSFQALKNVSLEIQQGEFVALVGKSGSGKTTLLNIIAGIDRPSSGSVVVSNCALQGLNEHQLSQWRGANIGIIFQFFQLLPTLTVIENVLLAMDFVKKIPARARRERAMQLLEQVGVLDQADKLPTALSGGQQQRVAIARAIANAPALLIADEPSGNLDTTTASTVFDLLRTMANNGTTVIVASHDKEIEQLSDRTILVADGAVTVLPSWGTTGRQQEVK